MKYGIVFMFLLLQGYARAQPTVSAKEFLDNGIAKADAKDYLGAIDDYSKAINLNPKYVDAYFNRGVAKGNVKDYAGAVADYTRTIELDPKDAVAYFNRGTVKVILKDVAGATADFAKAIKLDSKNFQADYNLCRCYAAQGETEKALKQLRVALRKGFNEFDRIYTDDSVATSARCPRLKH
jgi:tetratricopeptide (TPR) repeat protein